MPGGNCGSWYVKTETASGESSGAVSLFLFANEGKGVLGERVALELTCRSGVTTVRIGWWTVLGSTASVTWGFDDAPAMTAVWPLSVDKTASTYPYDAIEFIQRLLSAQNLVARVPYGAGFITAVFDPGGLANVIQSLREACGWPYSVAAPDADSAP